MFGFLKDKVKSAISSITDRFDKEAEIVETKEEEKLSESIQEEAQEILEEKKIVREEKKTAEKKKEQKVAENTPIPKEEKKAAPKKKDVKEEEKKGFFAKVSEAVTTKKISASQFEELFWDLEVELLENNVAFEVIEKIKQDLKSKLVDVPLKRGEVEKTIVDSLKESIDEVLDFESFDLLEKVKKKKEKPYVIVFIGVNGSGKTTTISKVAHLLKKNNVSSVLVAADTFRAASIQQLEEQGNRVGVKVIKHDYGSDPAAVAFDGAKYAQQKGIDVVLIDTAGRQHSNTNLMDEMKKIIRVVKPDLKIYIGEMITGNDCIEQIKDFDSVVNIDGVILSKADIDEKGGTALSVAYVTKKPIYYLGVGQSLEDLKPFNKQEIIKNLLS
ncbi:MAG: fused signal recognition particle receptor [archaeon GW2011_AR17]|nr:MAG: fused signal recognition particle receptor [archaeon GW2011_AR17]MBS3154335.1 signal recognition particle-docking protein FtsY [Candidatus Woesearchaeota archaeon]HIH15273.1 signal recognition particle-docking protein FtsY [Nanoarchaeota archaeon]HIH58572.1 signal recognition particle-docking protein FtsY [Nanoarchaeota archaeon]HII13767.1 signal recognition particle-docking protein FtsY [Nanoarchaeota archaeon]